MHFTTAEKLAGLAKAGPFLMILVAVGFFMYGGFATPSEVAAALPSLGRRLGRRGPFWEFLIAGWRDDGLLAG